MTEREALMGREPVHGGVPDESDPSRARTGYMATSSASGHHASGTATDETLRVPCPCHTDVVPGASLPPSARRQAAEDGVLPYAVSWRDMKAAAHMLGFGTDAPAYVLAASRGCACCV